MKAGTFCGPIGKQLVVAICPLPGQQCMWKHRRTGVCTYDIEFANSEFSSKEFAEKVGLPVVDEQVINVLKNSLAHKIRIELTV